MGASESFMTPARALLGDFGRAGVGSPVVGVMQITGRCAPPPDCYSPEHAACTPTIVSLHPV